MAIAAAILLVASKHKADSESSQETPDTRIDRNSAIALSIILFLVLVAVAWYLRLRRAQKRQAGLERQLQACGGHSESTLGRVTWNRQCSSCGHEMGRARSQSLSKLKSVVLRKDSAATSLLGGNPGTETGSGDDGEKRKWPGLYQWRTQDSSKRTSTLGPNALAIHENTLPLTSTERPCPMHSCRHSQRTSFDPLPFYNPLYHTPDRRIGSLLSQDTYDKRWWNEVARRGSTTSPTQRSSVLDAVLEPEVGGHAGDARAAGGPGITSRDHGRGSTGSAHASWKGSRCESIVYDWTRPTDAGVHARSDINFGGVIWDGPRDQRASTQEEKIQSMDWALKM